MLRHLLSISFKFVVYSQLASYIVQSNLFDMTRVESRVDETSII